MTKFQEKSFTVTGGHTDVYRDNFDRIFAKKDEVRESLLRGLEQARNGQTTPLDLSTLPSDEDPCGKFVFPDDTNPLMPKCRRLAGHDDGCSPFPDDDEDHGLLTEGDRQGIRLRETCDEVLESLRDLIELTEDSPENTPGEDLYTVLTVASNRIRYIETGTSPIREYFSTLGTSSGRFSALHPNTTNAPKAGRLEHVEHLLLRAYRHLPSSCPDEVYVAVRDYLSDHNMLTEDGSKE